LGNNLISAPEFAAIQFLKKIGMARVGRVSARPPSLAFPIYTSIGGYYAKPQKSSLRANDMPCSARFFIGLPGRLNAAADWKHVECMLVEHPIAFRRPPGYYHS
jgi:hypothetical protein